MTLLFEEWQSRLHPDDAELTLKAVELQLQKHLPFDVNYRLKLKSGEYRWFRAKGQAIWNEQGEPIRMAGSLSDPKSVN